MRLSIIKASSLNIIGALIPVGIAVPSLAILARLLDSESFTIYLLFLSLNGASSLFDLGLSRSVVREVAKNMFDAEYIDKCLVSSLLVVFSIGFFLFLVFVFFYSIGFISFSSDSLLFAILIFFPCLILMLGSKIVLSVYEGKLIFFRYNLHRIFSGLLLSIMPLICCFIFEYTIFFLILGLLIARLLCFFVDSFFVINNLRCLVFDITILRRLLVFGGWASVSSLINPVLSLFDRFLVGASSSFSVSSGYIVAADFVARLSILPVSIGKVLFPHFSSGALLENVRFLMLIILFPVVMLLFLGAEYIINLWLDGYSSSVSFIRVFLVGFVFNSLAQIPYARLHASGYARPVAISHLCQVALYIPILWFSIQYGGVLIAAWVWVSRVFLDWIALELMVLVILRDVACKT